MNITDINQFMTRESVYLGSCSYEDVKLEFDVTPHEYLEFMEDDLNGSDKRNLINALSNAKRALDCQIESLLYGFCLKSYTDNKRMGIPEKIELLNEIGIIAPGILRKVNKVRNMMEHEFHCPSIDEARDFADVILLFISYTDKFLFSVKKDCEIEDEADSLFCAPKFDRNRQLVIIDIKCDGNKLVDETIELKANNETIDSFINFVNSFIRICTF